MSCLAHRFILPKSSGKCKATLLRAKNCVWFSGGWERAVFNYFNFKWIYNLNWKKILSWNLHELSQPLFSIVWLPHLPFWVGASFYTSSEIKFFLPKSPLGPSWSQAIPSSSTLFLPEQKHPNEHTQLRHPLWTFLSLTPLCPGAGLSLQAWPALLQRPFVLEIILNQLYPTLIFNF